MTVAFVSIEAFTIRKHSAGLISSKLKMADVEVIFPNNKKTKVAVGSSLKDAAKKAG
jgi:hypothetical protein